MPSKRFFLVCVLYVFPLFSQDLRLFYHDVYDGPCTPIDEKLIRHAKESVKKALKKESKLNGGVFQDTEEALEWRTLTLPNYHLLQDLPSIPVYHLLNNLCALEGASHLQVGLLAGDSFIAALYGNESSLKQKIGVEWFKECPELFF